jgi:Domain of unknown function (DUF6089)
MKKFLLIIVVAVFSLGVNAQNGNFGVFAGAGYYNGELNQRSILYMPAPAFGILYRHNFDERWSLRIGVNTTVLKGNDATSSYSYNVQRGYSFSNRIWDLGPQVEFNFRNYNKDELMTNYFSPYITTGVLLTIVRDTRRPIEVAVPMGFGFKYAVTETITAGAEWSYRWSNSDELEGLLPDDFVLDPGDTQMSYNPDSDWYSFIGAFITVQIFKENGTCPAFQN